MKNDVSPTEGRSRLTVTVIAGDAENEIRDCLESVTWADEIIVVDSFSKDRTAEIAKEYTDKVILRKWEGYAKQKQYALQQAKNDWVLSLDTDERVSDELRREIESVLANGSPHDGYFIPRKNFFLKKWIKHCGWYPGYQLRFFRKSSVSLNGRKIHEAFVVSGSVGYLSSDIIHYTHPTIKDTLRKINEYSTLQAEEKASRKRATLLHILFVPPFSFLHFFIWKRGFLDGIHGLMVSIIHAATKAQTYMKMWEIQNAQEKSLGQG
jgi:glycosyltransferase involved in cell wall biosynthesis